MKRTLYAICALSLIWIAIAFYLAAHRAHRILIVNKKNSGCRIYSTTLGTQLMKPNCEAERTIAGFKSIIRFNNYGLPSPDVTEKKKGTPRICFLGGSTTVGLGISEANYVQKALQESISKALNRKVELINVSIEGYASAQHAVLLKEHLEQLHPDVVIAYTASGYKIFRDAVKINQMKTENSHFVRIYSLRHALPAWLYGIVHASEHLTEAAKTIIENVRYLELGRDVENASPDRPAQLRMVLEPTVRFLTDMDSTSREHGSRFYAAIDKADVQNLFSTQIRQIDSISFILESFSHDITIKNAEVRNYLHGKVNMVNVDAAFTDDDYFPGSNYFNEHGIRKFAESLGQGLAMAMNKNEN